ncbi:MAG TPA: hypothetical protein VF902_07790, partial [Coriobacteriia bacterium]
MAGHNRRLISAAVIAAVIAVSRAAPIDRVAPVEVRIFRAINDLQDRVLVFLWLPMQSGSFAAVPAAAIIALLSRRRAAGLPY